MLADFVPIDEDNFDSEVNEFRKHLDGLYKLCYNCELLITKVLDKRATNENLPKKTISQTYMNGNLFINKIDKVFQLVLPLLSNVAILLLIFYLLCISFHAYIFHVKENTLKQMFSSDHIYIFRQYYLHLIFSGLGLFFTQAYIRKFTRFSIDIILIAIWLMLILNSFKVNIFAKSYDELIELQQYLLASLFVVTVINIVFLFYDYFINTKRMQKADVFPKVDFKKSPLVCQNSLKSQPKLKVDDTHHIREQIQDLTLFDNPTQNSVQNFLRDLQEETKVPTSLTENIWRRRTLNSYSKPMKFGGTIFEESSVKFPSLQNSTPTPEQEKFSCYYNFSNASIYSSFVSSKPFFRKYLIQ